MAGTPIYPFDNDRLKTAKVIAALRGSSRLPEKRADWPNALECRQALVEKIAKATGTPLIKPSADRPFATALNAALGISSGGGSGGNGGGGGSYTAQAVHFEAGDNFLLGGNAASGTTQSASFSMWVNVPDAAAFAFFIHQAAGDSIDLSTGWNFPEFDIVVDALGGQINQGTPDNTLVLNTWLHMCGAMDLNHAQNSRVMTLFLNGVSVLDHSLDADSSAAAAFIDKTHKFVVPGYIAVSDGNLSVGGGEGVPFDVADYAIWLGAFIDWSVAANIAKIRNPVTGKPVALAGALTAFGTPQVLLSGDVSSFATNQGTGGAFTTIGTFTNAATSPST